MASRKRSASTPSGARTKRTRVSTKPAKAAKAAKPVKAAKAARPVKSVKAAKSRPVSRASATRAPRAVTTSKKPASPIARRADQVFLAFVMDQLERLRGVRSRAMFGGHGLYRGDEFFGIVHRARLYFRVSDETRARYVEREMEPFRPGKGAAMKTYYEVPPDVIEDPAQVTAWARAAAETARR